MGFRLVGYGKSLFPLSVTCPHCGAVIEIGSLSDLIDDCGMFDNDCSCLYCKKNFQPVDGEQRKRIDMERRGMVSDKK